MPVGNRTACGRNAKGAEHGNSGHHQEHPELISTVEDELDIEFGEPQNLETVGQLVAYIDSL